MNIATIVQKRWNYCNIMRDDGVFWLTDESLSDSDNLPAPEVIAADIGPAPV